MQEHVTVHLAEPLVPLVSGLHGYRMSGLAAGSHVGMPSRDITVIISLDEPMDMSVPGQGGVRLGSIVGGLHDRPVLIHHDGHQFGIQAALTPAGARALLGVPAAELAGLVVGLDDLLGPAARLLQERVVGAATWADRLRLVQAALLALLDRSTPPSESAAATEIGEAWRVLARHDGDVAVRAVARHVGWSPRHLTERFTSEFGLRPKTTARVMRFERSTRFVRAGARPADVAATCGYADQAHLTREWQALAGVTPGRWPASDVLANVQDPDGLPEAGWCHDHPHD